MQLDLGWIEDFIALTETRSFSQAARRRAISQSAFSKRIRSLELSMGGALILRKYQPLTLTPLGVQFLKDAGPILEAVRSARANAAGLLGKGQNEITFSAATSLAQSFYPGWITAKSARLPQMIPQITSSRTLPEELLALARGEVDFLLTYHSDLRPIRPDDEGLQWLVLGHEEILPVSLADGPGRARHDLDRRAGPVPYLARLAGSYIGALVEERITGRGLDTVRVFSGANGENVMGLLMRGAGVGWMPRDRIRQELAGAALVSAGGPEWVVPVEVRLYRQSGRLRPLVERFWSLLARDGSEFPAPELPAPLSTPEPRKPLR